jgi:type II secretory pathway pseudopilin PulG
MKSISLLQNNLQPTRKSPRKGFSIVEVAIAMAVVTLLLTTFLGVFGPAQANIQRALSTKDANRMKDALTNEMSILRNTDTSDTSSFAKAFRMISGSHTKATAILMYEYRADAAGNTTNGILPPYTGTGGIQGSDYIIQTAVRTLDVDATRIQSELAVVEGPVFVVRMTQLVDNDITDSELILTAWAEADGTLKPGITDPDNPSALLTAVTYPKAVVAFRAEFFKLSANKWGFVSSTNWSFTDIGNPVTEANIAIRR